MYGHGRENLKPVDSFLIDFKRIAEMGLRLTQSSEYKGWNHIEVTIDSGACDTVMPTDMCLIIKVSKLEQSNNTMEYDIANGQLIANGG